jgi:DNA-binding CsgD family transcriptional regulator
MLRREATVARHRTELIDRASEAGDVRELFAGVSHRLRRMVPFDAAVWMATDPATTLPAAPARTENLGHVCRGSRDALQVWELEFRGEDVNLYRDLAHAACPASALRLATGDRPARSARYRELIRPSGYEDELRLVLKIDGSPWAAIGLYRERGRPPFAAHETELMASLSEPLAATVREHARRAPQPATPAGGGPGLMVFAPDGELLSVNDEAHAWLDDLPPDSFEPDAFNVMLPMVAAGALMSARAIAAEREHGSARARLRSRSGRWLVCHASCLRDAAGDLGNTALVIEPAAAAEIAPLIVQAYELSAREQQITQLIAHGFGTAEMAERLHLSSHTVRDHVKAIFEKVGVSSRGELVATLFAEHFAPIHLDPANHERVSF